MRRPTHGSSHGAAYGAVRFAGYAALFDLADRGGDTIQLGAFSTLPLCAKNIPLLWQHDPARPVGVIEHLAEDARGLRVVGRFTDSNATARDAAALVRDRAVSGLSFGYRVIASRAGPPARGGQATRLLTAIELVEVSLVTNPMQPGARVLAVGDDDGFTTPGS